MSDVINNREFESEIKEKRQELLKSLILQLHEGVDSSIVFEEFKKHFQGVSAQEISMMEKSLMSQGIETEQIMKLCNIHANLFKGSVDEVHTMDKDEMMPGHPVRVLKDENFAVRELLDQSSLLVSQLPEKKFALLGNLGLLMDLEKHYSRKENCFFPLLEKYGHNAPSKVMWGVDDNIREMLKDTKRKLENDEADFVESFEKTKEEILEMIFKEEEILVPLLLDTFTEDEWLKIASDSEEIGYCLVAPETKWVPKRKSFVERYQDDQKEAEKLNDTVSFKIGHLSKKELELVLNTLPIDITFVDKDDVVKYFNQAKDRIFTRTKSVIGRSVQNCHPPKSVHTIEVLLDDFKSGKRDSEAFWIQMGPSKFVFIEYFAVRDELGQYMGVLEVTHDVKRYRDLEGDKRLLSKVEDIY